MGFRSLRASCFEVRVGGLRDRRGHEVCKSVFIDFCVFVCVCVCLFLKARGRRLPLSAKPCGHGGSRVVE